MKNIFIIAAILTLIGCAENTAENSTYSNEIMQLDNTYSTVDSNYTKFLNSNMDTMNHFGNLATEKYGKLKIIYKSDFIDTNYEKIMLIARGQFTKKAAKISKNSVEIKKEFEYSSNQYKILRENLIHENLEENKALTFYSEETQALIILNAEIVNFNEDLSKTISLAGVIIPQLDSIINVHEKPE